MKCGRLDDAFSACTLYGGGVGFVVLVVVLLVVLAVVLVVAFEVVLVVVL